MKITNDSQWKLGIIAEYTGKGMPQRNQLANLVFTDIPGKARAMMVQANLQEEIKYKLCKECFHCAMNLNNLAVVILNGKAAIRYEDFHELKPCYAKHFRIWGEAGTVSTRKNRKIGNRETPLIFIDYAKNNAMDCYGMYNPTTWYVTEMRDITWLQYCGYLSLFMG